jgi:hypothetical protein
MKMDCSPERFGTQTKNHINPTEQNYRKIFLANFF